MGKRKQPKTLEEVLNVCLLIFSIDMEDKLNLQLCDDICYHLWMIDQKKIDSKNKSAEYRVYNPEYYANYREKNKEKIKKYNKAYYKKNKLKKQK